MPTAWDLLLACDVIEIAVDFVDVAVGVPMWQTLFAAMQEPPQGMPFLQFRASESWHRNMNAAAATIWTTLCPFIENVAPNYSEISGSVRGRLMRFSVDGVAYAPMSDRKSGNS